MPAAARKQAPRRAEPAPRAAQRTPVLIAMDRIGKLALIGTAPHRMTAAVRNIIAEWRAGGISPSSYSAEMETLHDILETSVLAAEDCVGLAEDDKERKAVEAQVASLTAARDIVAAEMGRA
jgi:hypothetical protein